MPAAKARRQRTPGSTSAEVGGMVNIDEMIDARQQAQPGFKKAGGAALKDINDIPGYEDFMGRGMAYVNPDTKKTGDVANNVDAEEHLLVGNKGPVFHSNQFDAMAEAAAKGDLKASEPEGEKTESEEKITEDEVKEADTPEGKEDVRVGTEEAAARDDKAKAIEELGKAKDDEEKADEGSRPDIDRKILERQDLDPVEPKEQRFTILGIEDGKLICELANGATFKVPFFL